MCNWFKKLFGCSCKCNCQKNQEPISPVAPTAAQNQSSPSANQSGNVEKNQ